VWLIGREKQRVRRGESFRCGRHEGIRCHDRGTKGRKETDWEAAEGGEEESAGGILEIVRRKKCGGVDGLGLGVL